MQGSRKRSLSTLKSERGGHVIPANLETQDQAISAKFWGHQQATTLTLKKHISGEHGTMPDRKTGVWHKWRL